MSRFDSDLDYYAWLNGEEDDVDRDAHTTALEERLTDVALTAAKAALSAPEQEEGAA